MVNRTINESLSQLTPFTLLNVVGIHTKVVQNLEHSNTVATKGPQTFNVKWGARGLF